MTAEFRKIGDSIHKILDLEGVVSGGLVLKLYEDLFNENTSDSNFLQALYFFLGRGKSIGYLGEDYDLYIDGDMYYQYYTPEQANLFNAVKVNILEGYNKATIKTEQEEQVPLKDYHELERRVENLKRKNSTLSKEVSRYSKYSGFFAILTGLFLFSTILSLYMPTLMVDSNKGTVSQQPSTSGIVTSFYSDESRSDLKSTLTEADVISAKSTINNENLPDDVKAKELQEIDNFLSYFSTSKEITEESEKPFTHAEYVSLKDSIDKQPNAVLRSRLLTQLTSVALDRDIYSEVVSKLEIYPIEPSEYTSLESDINLISSYSENLKTKAKEKLKDTKEYVTSLGYDLGEWLWFKRYYKIVHKKNYWGGDYKCKSVSLQ